MPMLLYVEVIAGVLMIIAAGCLAWYVRPVDGKVNPRLKPASEPYVVVTVICLFALGIISAFHGIASRFA